MHNSLNLHFVYTTGRFPLPSTNMLWDLYRHGWDAGWPAVGQRGAGELGCRMGPHHQPAGWLWVMAAAAPRVAPSPGLCPKEQAQVHHRKVPMLSTSRSRPVVNGSGGHRWGRGVPVHLGGGYKGWRGSKAVPALGQGRL